VTVAFMMDFGGMARDPVWERFITAMVMYFMEHGGTVLFMERYAAPCCHGCSEMVTLNCRKIVTSGSI
jgi:hypothetical protein